MLDNAWYIDDGNNSSTGWWALTQWSNNAGAGTVYAAATIIRQSGTPTVGNERVYICVVAGTGGTGADPLTTFTRGVVITSGTATFQEATGVAALNGDLTNTPTWAQMRASSTTATLGQVIQRNNAASYQICTVSGTVGGSEPAFSNTAGTATTDNAATWRSLGAPSNFTGWQAPHARLASAFAANWGQAGNAFNIASTHAETQTTAMALNSPGTFASPCFVYVVNKSNVPPGSANLTTGATITTTSTGTLGIGTTGAQQCYYTSGGANGLIFSCGSGVNAVTMSVSTSGSGSALTFKNCALRLGGTSGGALALGNGAAATPCKLILDATTMQFASANSLVRQSGMDFYWINTPSAITGATFPTTLFTSSNSQPGVTTVRAVDLSALAAGKTIFGAITSPIRILLQDCKLNASATIAATPTSPGDAETYVFRSDSANTNYNQQKFSYMGTQTIETTIVRTGGASAGTAISWKVIGTANAKWVLPFSCLPLTVFNPRVSQNVTITVHGIWGGGAVPNNDQVWMEVEYLGTSGFPLGISNSGTKSDNLASGSPQTADTASVWGAGSTTAFQMQTTLSSPQPLSAGYLNIYVYSATTTTVYIDPLAVLS